MMKTYRGTKVINAQPMTRLEYNIFRGWSLPADENGADEGFLVEYTEGGKANTPTFKGYISWSPKDVFEKAYHEIEQPEKVSTFQERVVAEKLELDDRRAKLGAFYPTAAFTALPSLEQSLLIDQGHAMRDYSFVLQARINLF